MSTTREQVPAPRDPTAAVWWDRLSELLTAIGWARLMG